MDWSCIGVGTGIMNRSYERIWTDINNIHRYNLWKEIESDRPGDTHGQIFTVKCD